MTALNPVANPIRVDAYARKAVIASSVGYAMDGFDLLILGFILAPVSAALHLTAPQAGSLFTWTLIGAVIGIALGIVLAALLIARVDFITLSWPITSLIVFALVAVVAGLIAAILPARRASRLNVLEALQYE